MTPILLDGHDLSLEVGLKSEHFLQYVEMEGRLDSVTGIPSDSSLRESIETEAPRSLVRDFFAAASTRGEPASAESLLVAGAVSDLLLGRACARTIGPLVRGGECGAEGERGGVEVETKRECVHEILSAAWAFLAFLPQRDLHTKWLRQLPREDRGFLFVRSLEEVVAAKTLEEAAHRLSAILRALNDSELRDGLLLEAAAWTPKAVALASVHAAVAATRDESVEDSRPFWIRILESVYAHGAEIPLRPPSDAPPIGWSELTREWPDDAEELIDAWIERPRWLRAVEMSGTKGASVRLAVGQRLGYVGYLASSGSESPASESESVIEHGLHQAIPSAANPAVESAAISTGGTPTSSGGLFRSWIEQREQGRATRALGALRSGSPRAFLALVGLCAMRDEPPAIDERVVQRTYRALEQIA